MDLETNKKEELSYNKLYYQKTKHIRREKVQCGKCGRYICSEYKKKHQLKSICERGYNLSNNI